MIKIGSERGYQSLDSDWLCYHTHIIYFKPFPPWFNTISNAEVSLYAPPELNNFRGHYHRVFATEKICMTVMYTHTVQHWTWHLITWLWAIVTFHSSNDISVISWAEEICLLIDYYLRLKCQKIVKMPITSSVSEDCSSVFLIYSIKITKPKDN